MILDNFSQLRHYADMNPHFERVIAFFEQNNVATLADGRYDIDGTNAWVSVGNHILKASETARTEAHDRYIDIQIVIRGEERYGWIAREDCREIATPMNDEKDVVFYADRPTNYVDLCSGQMAIFCPADGHAPCIGDGEIRKAIVKVRVN